MNLIEAFNTLREYLNFNMVLIMVIIIYAFYYSIKKQIKKFFNKNKKK